jgi:hypothetical protein
MKSSILASAATMRIFRDKRLNVKQKLPIPGSSANLTLPNYGNAEVIHSPVRKPFA